MPFRQQNQFYNSPQLGMPPQNQMNLSQPNQPQKLYNSMQMGFGPSNNFANQPMPGMQPSPIQPMINYGQQPSYPPPPINNNFSPKLPDINNNK